MARQMASTTARGYGTIHQRERKKWEPVVKAGRATCARCDEPMDPNEPFDLGHNEDRTEWTGPEHVSCNRAAGARNATKVRLERQQTTIREW